MSPLTEAIQTGQTRYQPEINLSRAEEVNQQRLAFMVGAVAVGLPIVLLFVGLFLSTCWYFSISHYYYSQFWGSVFIGCLVFIGAYLLAWEGQSRGERILANIAGPFSWGIALFPTSGPGCTLSTWEGRVFADIDYNATSGALSLQVPENTSDYFTLLFWSSTLHSVSAAVMFSVLAYFALVVFTREVPERDFTPDGGLTPEKAARNRIYRTCGWIIVAMILCLAARLTYWKITGHDLAFWDAYRLTFICEAVMLLAFGLTWMVKGRFLGYALTDTRAVG